MRTQNYDPQAKIRPRERHRSQYLNIICIKLVTQVKKKLKKYYFKPKNLKFGLLRFQVFKPKSLGLKKPTSTALAYSSAVLGQ